MESKKLSKILIVDDDEDILIISKIAIKAIPDVTIFCASSGEDGVKMALEKSPDLILLDIMMPVMDGIATLKAMRLIPSTAKIPVVFFTARVNPKGVEEYLKLGAIDVIIKPFDPLELPNILCDIWDKYQSLTKSGRAI